MQSDIGGLDGLDAMYAPAPPKAKPATKPKSATKKAASKKPAPKKSATKTKNSAVPKAKKPAATQAAKTKKQTAKAATAASKPVSKPKPQAPKAAAKSVTTTAKAATQGVEEPAPDSPTPPAPSETRRGRRPGSASYWRTESHPNKITVSLYQYQERLPGVVAARAGAFTDGIRAALMLIDPDQSPDEPQLTISPRQAGSNLNAPSLSTRVHITLSDEQLTTFSAIAMRLNLSHQAFGRYLTEFAASPANREAIRDTACEYRESLLPD